MSKNNSDGRQYKPFLEPKHLDQAILPVLDKAKETLWNQSPVISATDKETVLFYKNNPQRTCTLCHTL